MLSPDDLRVPLSEGWLFEVGFDTGTYMSSLFAGVTPDPRLIFIFEEFPNYRYVGGEIELLGETNAEWAERVWKAAQKYRAGGLDRVSGWVDTNTQFRNELLAYGLLLRGNRRKLELRTEISRGYFQANQILLMPWLTVLPYEIEHAQWPPEGTTSGKYERIKRHDHTLDCLEHILSRHPRSSHQIREEKKTFLERMFEQYRLPNLVVGDRHLGLN